MLISRASHLFAPLAILFLFAPAWIGDERLAFRDVSHFYTPLYDYVAARTADQWLPLWNPLDQTGMPLLGETSTAVLYPVRYLIFSLPIATETAMAWYVVFHLILASIAARTAASWAGIESLAANLAGILYPLSGSVLFLYTNPPFLVGAAWLPLAVGVMLARQPTNDSWRVIIAAPSLAMMILGGDPQMALHAMMIIGSFYVVQRFLGTQPALRLKSVIAVPVVAALLSAPQIAASVSWSRHSDRTVVKESGQWLAPPEVGSRRAESFQFSFPPWHVVELVTPNAAGSLLPTYRRISQLITGDGRMWTPTIYMGMLVVVALAICLMRQSQAVVDRWLVVAIVGLCLSMGHFGLVMLIQSTTGGLANIDSAVGGPYWLLYHAIPGYDSFRYPAKWLPVFTLGLAIATAQVFDRYTWQPIRWRWFVVALATFVVGVGIFAVVRQNPGWIIQNAGQTRRDEFWGPLDLAGGFLQIQWSIVHSAIALLAIFSLTRLPRSRQFKLFLLLIVVAIDLGVAGRDLIATVPIDREQALVSQRVVEPPLAGSKWMRTRAGDGWPVRWKQQSDPQRLLDVEASLRTSRFGRWHLSNRIGMLNNMVSIRSQNMKEFWSAAGSANANMNPTERQEFWNGIRRWLSIDGVVHVPTSVVEVADGDRVAMMIDQRRVWSPHDGSLGFTDLATEQTLMTNRESDYRERLLELAIHPVQEPVSAKSTEHTESSIYREVQLDEPGLLTRSIFQDGHWQAEFSPVGTEQWTNTKVHQVDRITQGVILPAGTWDIRFRYEPVWLLASLVISGLAWLGLAIYCRRLRFHRESERPPNRPSMQLAV